MLLLTHPSDNASKRPLYGKALRLEIILVRCPDDEPHLLWLLRLTPNNQSCNAKNFTGNSLSPLKQTRIRGATFCPAYMFNEWCETTRSTWHFVVNPVQEVPMRDLTTLGKGKATRIALSKIKRTENN